MAETRPSSDRFDPANLARSLASEDAGTGLSREKHPTPTLRVFQGDEADWFEYGGFIGGRQGVGWIERVYRGVLWWEDGYVFGVWRIRVEGDEIEKLAMSLAKQVRTTLRVGRDESGGVASIRIEPVELKVMEGAEE